LQNKKNKLDFYSNFAAYLMKMAQKINIRNKKAGFEYFLLEKFVAGLMLTGTEIKSIRSGKASISEAYCIFVDQELYVRNMNISEYDYGTYNNHDPRRDRKLLLTRRELKKLKTRLEEKGHTLVALSLFINDKGLAKLEIALGKGKKLYDKRETTKTKDIQRELERGTY
jgi:SsrA-binding protein